jgi:hypothetical protein
MTYVARLWEALPERRAAQVLASARRRNRVAFTLDLRRELRSHHLGVGLSVNALFEGLESPPPGRTVRRLLHCLSDHPPRSVRRDHLECVMAGWQSLPSGLGRPRSIDLVPHGRDTPEL